MGDMECKGDLKEFPKEKPTYPRLMFIKIAGIYLKRFALCEVDGCYAVAIQADTLDKVAWSKVDWFKKGVEEIVENKLDEKEEPNTTINQNNKIKESPRYMMVSEDGIKWKRRFVVGCYMGLYVAVMHSIDIKCNCSVDAHAWKYARGGW